MAGGQEPGRGQVREQPESASVLVDEGGVLREGGPGEFEVPADGALDVPEGRLPVPERDGPGRRDGRPERGLVPLVRGVRGDPVLIGQGGVRHGTGRAPVGGPEGLGVGREVIG